VRASLIAYSQSVINDEWPHMNQGALTDTENQTLTNVWNAYYSVNAANHKQEQWYSVSINKLNLMMNARLARLLGSRESLGDEMWTMLILGAVAVVAFMCFFGLDSLTTHLLMAGVLAGSAGFLLFLIYSLDTAFSGNVSIPPEAMKSVLKAFQ